MTACAVYILDPGTYGQPRDFGRAAGDTRTAMSGGGVIGGVVVLVAALCAPTAAQAQDGSKLRLVVKREAGTEDCPDASALRQRVADVLLSDPFDSNGRATLECTTSRTDAGYAARLVMNEPDGTRVGERELTTSDDSCASLADLLELAVATAASGYAHRARDAKLTANAQADANVQGRLEGPIDPPLIVEDERTKALPLFAGLGARVGLHSDGSSSTGAALTFGSRLSWLSLQLELQIYSPQTFERSTGDTVTVGSGSAWILACAHRGPAAACVVAAGGWVRGSGTNLMFAQKPITPSLATGARLVWEASLPGSSSVRASVDFMRAVTSTRFTVGDDVVWETPPYAALVGVSLIRQFR